MKDAELDKLVLEQADEIKGEKTVIAVALPPQTGLPLSEFIYEGKKLDMKFIRENGPSEAYSNAEDYEDADRTAATPDTQVNKP